MEEIVGILPSFSGPYVRCFAGLRVFLAWDGEPMVSRCLWSDEPLARVRDPIFLTQNGLNGVVTGTGWVPDLGPAGKSGVVAPGPEKTAPAAVDVPPRVHEPIPPGEVKFHTNEVTTHAGLANPHNTGPCTLVLAGVDADRKIIRDGGLQLLPGEGVNGFYHAPAHAVAIVVSAFDCAGFGELSYDRPLS